MTDDAATPTRIIDLGPDATPRDVEMFRKGYAAALRDTAGIDVERLRRLAKTGVHHRMKTENGLEHLGKVEL